eukprot:3858087-Prymnesium_polylepis.1
MAALPFGLVLYLRPAAATAALPFGLVLYLRPAAATAALPFGLARYLRTTAARFGLAGQLYCRSCEVHMWRHLIITLLSY